MGRSLRENQTGNNYAEQRESESALALQFCIGVSAEIDSPAAQRCEQYRQYADLNAQMDMAHFARAQAWLGFFAFMGLLATVFYARNAWRSTLEQVRIARRGLEELERPHFFARIVLSNARVLPSGTDLIGSTHYTFDNLGRSPGTLHVLNVRHFAMEGDAWPPCMCRGQSAASPLDVFPDNSVIGANQSVEPPLTADPWQSVSQSEVPQNATWFFMGWLIYRSLSGDDFVLGFCFRLDPDSGWFRLTNPPLKSGLIATDYNFARVLPKGWETTLVTKGV